MKMNSEEMIAVMPRWSNADRSCVGVDIEVAWASSVVRRVRLFLKMKYGDFDGRSFKFPRWYLNGALRRATEMLPHGWFLRESGAREF